MKQFVSLGAALLLGSALMAFPWSTPPCEESGTWCRDSNSGQSAFNGWQPVSYTHLTLPTIYSV